MKTEDYQKTSIEILSEFAEATGRTIEFTEQNFPGTRAYSILAHKRTLYIPNNSDETSYFIAYQNHKDVGETGLYCGVFMPISLPLSTTLNIREQHIFDKLNPFLNKRTLSTGSKRFDNKVVITGNDLNTVRSIFTDSQIQKLVLETLKLAGPLNITVNEPDFDFVPDLKGKSRFGIYNKHEWFMEAKQIEPMFKLIEVFREML